MGTMKISTEIGSIAQKVGMEKAVEYCGKAGFDAWDLSLFELCRVDHATGAVMESGHPLTLPDRVQLVRRLRQIGEGYGMVCNQSHAPFPSAHPVIRTYLKTAIELTAEAGGKICVIHPDNNASAETNAVMFRELLPYAKACGVKIATENMWGWDKEEGRSRFAACATSADFLAHLQAVNDESFVACLDIGHAEMKGSGDGAAAMIRALGPHLQALHLHDNDCLHDSHQLPMTMDIDFDAVTAALKEIGYSGYFTLEADQYLRDLPPEAVQEGVFRMAEAARTLAHKFDTL